MKTSDKVQFWLVILISFIGIFFMVSTYFDWYIPNSIISFSLGLLSFVLYGITVVQNRSSNRKKEVILLSILSIYINLFISGFIYRMWSYETILTKVSMVRFSMFFILLASIYLIVAYVRAKITYKQVKGNQRDNVKWHLSKKELRDLQESEDIYINLGFYHERKD